MRDNISAEHRDTLLNEGIYKAEERKVNLVTRTGSNSPCPSLLVFSRTASSTSSSNQTSVFCSIIRVITRNARVDVATAWKISIICSLVFYEKNARVVKSDRFTMKIELRVSWTLSDILKSCSFSNVIISLLAMCSVNIRFGSFFATITNLSKFTGRSCNNLLNNAVNESRPDDGRSTGKSLKSKSDRSIG